MVGVSDTIHNQQLLETVGLRGQLLGIFSQLVTMYRLVFFQWDMVVHQLTDGFRVKMICFLESVPLSMR